MHAFTRHALHVMGDPA